MNRETWTCFREIHQSRWKEGKSLLCDFKVWNLFVYYSIGLFYSNYSRSHANEWASIPVFQWNGCHHQQKAPLQETLYCFLKASLCNSTCLSIGKNAGVVSLKCVFKYSLPEALEHDLLTYKTHTCNHENHNNISLRFPFCTRRNNS